MKAVYSEKYGSPETLTIKEVLKPAPKKNEVLVRVHASSINVSNLILLTGKPTVVRLAFGITKPKYSIPGGDVAGVVEGVGESVSQFKVGDEVYGDLSSSGWGALAEYVAADEKALAVKPSNLTFAEAAAIPMAATTALQALRDKGKIMARQEVLIYGASGGVGTFAIQIVKAYGAEVTAVVSTRNVDIAKSLGADHVLDYKKGEFTADNKTYDLIIGVNGSSSIFTYKKKLKDDGVFVHVGGDQSQMFQEMILRPWLSLQGKKKFTSLMQKPNQADLMVMKEMIEEGKVKPVIDQSYTIDEVVKAFNYVNQGHSQGKVVVTI